MLQLLSRYKGIVVVGLLLLLPLMLLYAQTKRPGARGPVVGVIVDVAAGLERAMLWATGGVLDGIEHYVTSVASWRELVALRREHGMAVAWWARAEELQRENDELRAVARAVAPIDGPRPLGARVVARTGAPVSSLITIDVGSADGVRRGDGVIDKAGVVGVVLAVGRRASDVLLVSDSRSAVDVVVQRTRARGILRGSGSEDRYGVSVDDFDKLRDVKPGDAVVTSGLGARFPPGLLVGTVLETHAPDDSLYVEAEVRPATAFDRVEHVQVLIERPPPRAPRLGEEPLLDDVDAGPGDAGPVAWTPRPKPIAAAPAGAVVDAGPTPEIAPVLDAGPAPPAPPAPGAPAPAPGPASAPPASGAPRDGGSP